MNYTKGKWEVDLEHINGHSGIDISTMDRCIGSVYLSLYKSSKSDKGNISLPENAETVANANLICSAVNACQKINPDNPLAVAETLSDMYEALKEFSNYHPKQGYESWLIMLNKAQSAIAKADGKIDIKK